MNQSQNKTRPTSGPWQFGLTGSVMRGYSQSHAIVAPPAKDQTGRQLISGCFCDIKGGEDEAEANARLIAAAGTSASTCYASGYDGTKCVENVAEIVKELSQLYDEAMAVQEMHGNVSSGALRQTRDLLSNLKN